MSQSMQGQVKWFDANKGYGFIKGQAQLSDVLVHHTAIQSASKFKTLKAGQAVIFVLTPTAKGPKATHVEPLQGANP